MEYIQFELDILGFISIIFLLNTLNQDIRGNFITLNNCYIIIQTPT